MVKVGLEPVVEASGQSLPCIRYDRHMLCYHKITPG